MTRSDSQTCTAAESWADAQVTKILTEGQGAQRRAVGVRMADGRTLRARTVVSNATHWDTFDRLLSRSAEPTCKQCHMLPSLEAHHHVRLDALAHLAWPLLG